MKQSIQTIRPIHCSARNYETLLVEQGKRLAAAKAIDALDCTDVGVKSTHCNVGLCGEWAGRLMDGIYFDTVKGQHCPLDTRTDENRKTQLSGCFYTCAVFTKKESLEQCRTRYDRFMENREEK